MVAKTNLFYSTKLVKSRLYNGECEGKLSICKIENYTWFIALMSFESLFVDKYHA